MNNLWKTTIYSKEEVDRVIEILGDWAMKHRVEMILHQAARINISPIELARITSALLADK